MKKIIMSVLVVFFFLPNSVFAATISSGANSSVSITAGELTFVDLPNESILFENYSISGSAALVRNTSPITMSVNDFRGTYAGWKIDVKLSDLVGPGGDLISSKDSSLDVKCSNVAFTAQPFTCNSDVNLPITTTGTIQTNLINANNDSTSAGTFTYSLPVNFFALNFNNKVKVGTYSGTLLFDIGSTYAP